MIDKQTLEKEYVDNQLTTRDIAQKYNIGATTVKRMIKKYGIKPNSSKRHIPSKSILTRDFLQLHYTTLNKTCKQISEETGITATTIGRALTRCGIIKRRGTRAGRPNKNIPNKTELIGHHFGRLVVQKYVRGGWLCQCDCGQTKVYKGKRLTTDGVKSCGCLLTLNGSDHHLWKGCGEISQTLYSSYYNGAMDRGIDFDVSIEYLWSLFLNQNNLCAISKVPIKFSKQETTASLDRIDSNKPYVNNNVQWVHKDINQMKWTLSQSDFVNWCKTVANANPD